MFNLSYGWVNFYKQIGIDLLTLGVWDDTCEWRIEGWEQIGQGCSFRFGGRISRSWGVVLVPTPWGKEKGLTAGTQDWTQLDT